MIASCASSTPSNGDIDAANNTNGDGNNTHPDSNQVTDPDANVGPIDANTCPTQPCTLDPQCGCASNQACDIDFTDLMGNACRGVTAQGMAGSTCTAVTDCAGGYVCVGDGTNDSCEKYCASTADCGSPRGQCVIQLTNGGTPITGATTCSSNCDPAAASNPLCPASWSCDLFTAAFMGTTYDISDCRKAGTLTQGQTCDPVSAPCASRFSCVNTGSNVCARICNRTTGGTECSASPGTTCTGFTTPFVVGTTEYGVCI
jgi:hypothetical protein